MQITLFSFLVAVLWSSFLILAGFYFRKKVYFVEKFGVIGLLIFYALCGVRILFPLEFPFTKVIVSEQYMNTIYNGIGIYRIPGTRYSPLHILLFLWIFGAVILLFRFCLRYLWEIKEIHNYQICDNEQCKRVFQRVLTDTQKKLKIEIRHSTSIHVPLGIGIRHKMIILPIGEYTDDELYYILLHEYTHFLNKDLYIKMLVHIFCYFFWWNPIVYLLQRELNQTLELKCDLKATQKMNADSKANYLSAIVAVLKQVGQYKHPREFQTSTLLVQDKHKNEIVERFRMIRSTEMNKKNHGFSVLVFVCILFLSFMFSYSFVVQPRYNAPITEIEDDNKAQMLIQKENYLILHRDGSYTLVLSATEQMTIDEETALRMISSGFEVRKE